MYRITPSGAVQEVGSYDGTVHHCVDESYLAGTGYYVTMEIRDPLDD